MFFASQPDYCPSPLCPAWVVQLDRSIHDSRAISVTHAHNKGPSGGPYNDGPSHYDDHPRRARTPTEQKFRITLGGLPSQMDWKCAPLPTPSKLLLL